MTEGPIDFKQSDQALSFKDQACMEGTKSTKSYSAKWKFEKTKYD